jgi:hypothetical protein
MTTLQALHLMHRIQRRLLDIEQAMEIEDVRKNQGENTMVDPQVAALIAKFDAATDKIAARIQTLIDAGGLSAESAAALQAEVTKLEALGADQNDPVPVV